MNQAKQKADKPYYQISSLVKGLRVLELLAGKESLTVTEVAGLLDMDRSACNRFLLTLRDMGYVKADQRARYRLTLKVFEIGNKIANIVEIRPIARPYMRKLVNLHKETVNLGHLDGFDIVTIDVVSGRAVIRFDSPIGSCSPIHTLAMGKAILAFRPEEEQAAYLESVDFKPFTPNTITDVKRFRKELEKVRRQGYALDNEEWAIGVCCVAAPVFDFTSHPSHAISISGPSRNFTDDKVAKIIKDLTILCKSLSEELSARNT
jgi:IclR family KDG regulon transcriptional repressor